MSERDQPSPTGPSGRSLSNLEMTVLGLAWLRGPCTTYAIMKELSLSESSFHKSRAGAAYSISKRLLKFRLLEKGESDPKDSVVRITPEGIAALRNWLTPPIPRADIAHSADLVRLRMFFLEAVDKEVRLAFVDDSLDGLYEFLKTCEGLMPQNEAIGDYFGVLATTSTILETRARIQWLTMVRELIIDPLPEGVSWSDFLIARCRDLGPPVVTDRPSR